MHTTTQATVRSGLDGLLGGIVADGGLGRGEVTGAVSAAR